MAKVRMQESRLRELLKMRLEQCTTDVLIGAADKLLSADLTRECTCGSFVGEIPNREIVRDESLEQFLEELSFDERLMEVAKSIDQKLPLSQFRVELRLSLVRQGLHFDEDIITTLCHQVRAR